MNNGITNTVDECVLDNQEHSLAVCTSHQCDSPNLVMKDPDLAQSNKNNVIFPADFQSPAVTSTEHNRPKDDQPSIVPQIDNGSTPISSSPVRLPHTGSQQSISIPPTQTFGDGSSELNGTSDASKCLETNFVGQSSDGIIDASLPGSLNSSQNEYYVMVHVDAGETFSVRAGDQIQHIRGPATVRMVSNSGPPLPMPMRVPPGHLVQQIVDEEGILTHVILSLYPGPNQPPPSGPSGSGQPGSVNGAALTPVTHSNGLITSCPGLILDPNLHLHPHHHAAPHPHHHPHPHHPAAQSSVSAVSGGAHLGVGLPTLTPFTPHQAIPNSGPPPGSPSGAAATNFAPTQFLPHPPIGPQPHFHTSYPFHPSHPHHHSICSQGLKPIPQQTPALVAMDAHSYPPQPIPVTNWPVNNGIADHDSVVATASDRPVMPVVEDEHLKDEDQEHVVAGEDKMGKTEGSDTSTEHAIANNQHNLSLSSSTNDLIIGSGGDENLNQVVSGLSHEKSTVASELALSMNTSTVRLVKRPPRLQQQHQYWTNVPKPTKDGRGSNHFNRTLDECSSTRVDGSLIETRAQLDNWSKYVPCTTSTNAMSQQNSPVKAVWSKSSSTGVSTSLSVGDVPINGIDSESTHLQSVASSNVLPATDNSWTTHGVSHRRRRTGTGRNNPAVRIPSRPTGFVSAKYNNLASSSDVSLNIQHGSSPNTGKKFSTSGSRSSTTNPNTAISTEDLVTYSEYKINHLNSPPSYSTARARARTQQPYLLSTPPSHLPAASDQECPISSTAMHYPSLNPQTAPLPTGCCKATAETMGTVGGVVSHDKTHLTWESDVEREAIQSVLSTIPSPQVSEIEAHSALIQLRLPADLTLPLTLIQNNGDSSEHSFNSNFRSSEMRTKGGKMRTDSQPAIDVGKSSNTSLVLDEAEVQFELHLSEREMDSRFNCVFVGEATYISLQDLRPGSEYYVKACCVYGDIRGQFSSVVRFTTEPSQPSAPRNLTVVGHTRTALHVKWSAAADNGSRITAYRLEYARASPTFPPSPHLRDDPSSDNSIIPHFVEGFHGLSKSCKLTQLTPSTDYLLRVMAENSFGASPWSAVVAASTSGSPPPTPRTPHLISSGVHSLTLAWAGNTANQQPVLANPPTTGASGTTVSYMLEMEDEAMGHGFVTVFDGTGTEHCVGNLRRNTRYRFRLAAANSDGRSRWSEVVTLSTLPDHPTTPRALRLSGPPRPNRLCLLWDAPEDDGGLGIQSYRLEAYLPYIASSKPSDTDDWSNVEKLLCWPRATAAPEKSSFCSLPPNALRSGDDQICPVMPKYVPPETLNDFATVSHSEADLTLKNLFQGNLVNCNNDATLMGWFIVYEGLGLECVLDHLLPGSHFLFRVRACSARGSGTQSLLIGPASAPPLSVVLPAVAPDAPPGPPRLIGQPGPHSVCLTWPVPKSTGGVPILAYEVWQMDSSPLDSSSDAEENYVDNGSPVSNSPLISTSSPTHSRSSSGCSAQLEDSALTALQSPPVYVPSADNLHVMGRLVCSVPSAECRVTGLRPGYTYAFRVRACNQVGQSAWTGWAQVSTVPGPPAAPRHAPHLHAISHSNRIRVTWDPVRQGHGAPVSGYVLEWQPLPNQVPSCSRDALCAFQLLYSGPALLYELDGVQPATRFAFRYCAINAAGSGPWSPIATCLTPPACPGQPCGLRAARVKKDTVQLHWFSPQPNGSPITSFKVELTRLNKGPNSNTSQIHLFEVPSPLRPSVVTPITSSSVQPIDYDVDDLCLSELQLVDYTLTDLTPNSSYCIRIAAMNGLGYGVFSSPLHLTTLPPHPDAPRLVGFTHLTATSVRVQWSLPESLPVEHTSENGPTNANEEEKEHHSQEQDANVTVFCSSPSMMERSMTLHYTLQLSQDSDPEWTVIYEGTETSYKVTRLQENSAYSFRVCASNVSGTGPYSVARSVNTPRLPPPTVRGLKVTEVSASSCQVEWSPITLNTCADPLVYVLHLMPVQQVHTGIRSIPSQVYRGCQTICRVTDLLPNTEYVCRVGAIRLCQPKHFCITKSSVDRLKTENEWVRELVTNPDLQISELPGAFSHSVLFTTKNIKETKTLQNVGGVSASHLHTNTLFRENRQWISCRWFRWLWTVHRFFWSQQNALTPDPAYQADPTSANGSVGHMPFDSGSHSCGSVTSSPWRRRPGPIGPITASPQSMKLSTSPTLQVTGSHQQPAAHHHHHHSNQRRGHSWFRLSERKWACLLLCLFAIATLLVAFSVQHVITVQPNGSTITIEEVRPSSDQSSAARKP